MYKVAPTFDTSTDPWLMMRFSDVEILAFGKSFPLHTALLCSSPYFNSSLTREFQDLQGTAVQLVFAHPNIDPRAFCNMLTFLHRKTTSVPSLATHRVLAAAHFFGVEQLVDLCLGIIKQT